MTTAIETEFVPTPALMLAHGIVSALRDDATDPLLCVASILVAAERKGRVVFTDETTPRYETSRPSTGMENALGEGLAELITSIAQLPIEDVPFWENTGTDEVKRARARVRRAIGAGEKLLGL